jgi:hypothetical protein
VTEEDAEGLADFPVLFHIFFFTPATEGWEDTELPIDIPESVLLKSVLSGERVVVALDAGSESGGGSRRLPEDWRLTMAGLAVAWPRMGLMLRSSSDSEILLVTLFLTGLVPAGLSAIRKRKHPRM